MYRMIGPLRSRTGLLVAICAASALLAGEVAAADPPALRRSTVDYTIPDLELVTEEGRSARLRSELDDGRPVVLNFIYTSCQTTCPMSSVVFASFQRKLGAASRRVHLVSISIDPDQDTPPRLREYSSHFAARAGWSFYTGSVANILAAQRAFDAYRGDKMNHIPVTLLRKSPGAPWTRLEGLIGPDELYKEYLALQKQR